jgi:purine-binding chemotaxis protein CheW
MSTTHNVDPTQFLSFQLAGEEYAVNILRVKEIIEYADLTRVPGMPASVRGVLNMRGRVVPVVDLALRFGLPASQITPRSCIVMVEIGSGESAVVMGIIADAVSEVLDLTAEQIQSAPSFGTSVGAEYLDGMAEATGKKFVMLLNVERALSAEAFAAHQQEAIAA